MPYVVELEFFHLPLHQTLGDLFAEARERIRDEVPLKIHLRVLDTLEEILPTLKESEALRRKDRILHEQFSEAKRWRRMWLDCRIRWLARRRSFLRKVVRAWAVARIRRAVRDKEPVGIEVHRGKSWRLVEKNERHELGESIQKSEDVWIFVFEGQDLLGTQQTMVTNHL